MERPFKVAAHGEPAGIGFQHLDTALRAAVRRARSKGVTVYVTDASVTRREDGGVAVCKPRKKNGRTMVKCSTAPWVKGYLKRVQGK